MGNRITFIGNNIRVKKIFTTLIIVCSFYVMSCKAQWVTIPDPYFSSWLQVHYPGCMNGNQMDTTCSQITNDTMIYINNPDIVVLTGIKYFDSLKRLDCSYLSITNLSILPNYLTYLNCSNNSLSGLPNLPNSLKILNCNDNHIVNLPSLPPSLISLWCGWNLTINSIPPLPATLDTFFCYGDMLGGVLPLLPDSLIYLSCGANQLTALPSLPNSVTFLSCASSPLINLPAILPPNLVYLECYNCQLGDLPSLPNTLKELYFPVNQISSLPILPDSLEILYGWENQLTSLPALPDNLIDIALEYNQLTSLPQLPSHLLGLSCNNNQLSTLPAIPNSLNSLWCYNNLLTNLPELPDTLYDLEVQNNPGLHCLPSFHYFGGWSYGFNISGTAITCLPNHIIHQVYNAAIDTMPICDSINSNGCPFCLPDTVNLSASICSGDTLSFNGQHLTSSGNYSSLVFADNGCDSIIKMNLTVLNSFSSTFNAGICAGDSFNFYGNNITNSGNYSMSFTSSNGCDSVIHLSLSVFNPTSSYQTQSICHESTYDFNGTQLSISGNYLDTVINLNGCDSVIHLTLVVDTVNTEIEVVNSSMVAISTGTFHWFDCDLLQLISGETQSTFTPINSGNFAAIITESNCTDTSNCYYISINSIEEISNPVSLYPNPTSENITVEYNITVSGTLTIYNLLGEQVQEISLEKTTNNKNISLTNIASGIYFCVLRTTDGKTAQQKLVVEK